jgi:IclR helix-turn-helix domain
MAGRSVTLRALSILDAFDSVHRRLKLTDIARRSNLPLATAHRHVQELVNWHALERKKSANPIRTSGAVASDPWRRRALVGPPGTSPTVTAGASPAGWEMLTRTACPGPVRR